MTTNYKKQSVIVAAVVFIAMAAFPAGSQAVVIDGMGKETCGDLIELMQVRPDGKDAAPLGLWAMGYLFGAARHSHHVAQPNIVSINEVGKWLGEYCVIHPENKLMDALDVFIDEHQK